MKISESTFEVLQNFSSINNGITVQEGSEIKTISPMKNIFGKAPYQITLQVSFLYMTFQSFLQLFRYLVMMQSLTLVKSL